MREIPEHLTQFLPRCLLHPKRFADTVICLGCGDWLEATINSWSEITTSAGTVTIVHDTCTCGQIIATAATARGGLTVESVKVCGNSSPMSLPICKEDCFDQFFSIYDQDVEELRAILGGPEPVRALAELVKCQNQAVCANFVNCHHFHAPVIGCLVCGKSFDSAREPGPPGIIEQEDGSVIGRCWCGSELRYWLLDDDSCPNTRQLCRRCSRTWGDQWRDKLNQPRRSSHALTA